MFAFSPNLHKSLLIVAFLPNPFPVFHTFGTLDLSSFFTFGVEQCALFILNVLMLLMLEVSRNNLVKFASFLSCRDIIFHTISKYIYFIYGLWLLWSSADRAVSKFEVKTHWAPPRLPTRLPLSSASICCGFVTL